MNYEERLENVSVLGAAGKMGSGILLLTAVEMADLSLQPGNKDKTFVLNAIDVSAEGLAGLMNYLREQVRKVAKLARLDLTDSQVAEFSDQLSAVLEYVEKMNELDTDSVTPLAHCLPVSNCFRDEPS